MKPVSRSIHSQIKHILSDLAAFDAPEHFNTCALQLFDYQYQQNPPYRRYCDSVGISPKNTTQWQEIPALSTDVLKLTPSPSCLAPAERLHHFLTSGTTTDTRGVHHFQTTYTYEASILAAWQHLQLPTLHDDTWILTPSPEQAPHSSLCHMFGTLRDKLHPSATFALSDDHLHPRLISQLQQSTQPITLLGTALSTLRLIEELPAPITLPAGSWLLETGGYKGSNKELTKPALYELIEQQLGIPPTSIWNEYSMTELSSQCYTSGTDAPHSSPPWMKIRVIDPETSRHVASGELGYLCLYDLANVDSLLAIRTQDLAIYHNEHQFTLIGRDPSALPRGCSRTIL